MVNFFATTAIALGIGAWADATHNITNDWSSPQTVTFPSGDSSVVGLLYLPEIYKPNNSYPAVAVAGSFGSTKEMMSGTYAAELAKRGIIAGAIDYRNFGQSGGAMRQYEDPDSKADDLSAAVKYLSNRHDVAKTGLMGVCTSGGNVLYAAAQDRRVEALATVVGFFQTPDVASMLLGGDEGLALRRAAGRQARKVYETTGELQFIRQYSNSTNATVNYGPAPYYDSPSRGGGVRSWRNDFAVMAWEAWLSFNPVAQAPKVYTPTLMIYSENAAFPDQARAVYDGLAGEKRTIWTNGSHYDFYDNTERVRFSADQVAVHFQNLLA